MTYELKIVKFSEIENIRLPSIKELAGQTVIIKNIKFDDYYDYDDGYKYEYVEITLIDNSKYKVLSERLIRQFRKIKNYLNVDEYLEVSININEDKNVVLS